MIPSMFIGTRSHVVSFGPRDPGRSADHPPQLRHMEGSIACQSTQTSADIASLAGVERGVDREIRECFFRQETEKPTKNG